MDVHEFRDEDWRGVLEEFRLLVVRAGYADWDASMVQALDEAHESLDSERFDRRTVRSPLEDIRLYVDAFIRFLKVRSRYVLASRRDQLASLLRTESGIPVRDFVLDIDGTERPIFTDDDGLDAMINELGRFLAELNGEHGRFWGGGDDRPDGDT